MKPAITSASMEPVLPPEGLRSLEDLAIELTGRANALAGLIHPVVREAIGELLRSMNCYYSNLIEGHDTHPRDIERALVRDYATEPRRRALQLEAVAHIEVQRKIDEGEDPADGPVSAAYIVWLHAEFCSRLPEEMLWVEDPASGEKVRIAPGRIRTREVLVGRHVPPVASSIADFLQRFEKAYSSSALSRLRQITAIAAAHHRLLWVHPFLDGNGRVARLMSHAMLKRAGIGSSLWSVSRGLARNVNRYKELLMAADEPRRNDLDGRGNLSEAALVEFCEFFLQVCIDQVEFMNSLLQPSELLRRIEIFSEDETRAGRLLRGSFPVLRETLLAGEVSRGRAREVTGYQERMGRMIVSRLLASGILRSAGPRAPLRLAFPVNVVERWFPRLYPAG